MLPTKRKQEIIRLTKEKQGISIADLSSYFKVSNMTILRDVKDLSAKNMLEIVRGGVVPVGLSNESQEDNVNTIYDIKKRQSLSEKQQIARYCAETFITDGSVIALEGGSTACSIIRFLTHKQKITLISNGYFVLKEAIETLPNDFRIVCTGGLLESPYLLFLGPDVESFFMSKYPDVAFLSCVAFDLNMGPMDSYSLEVQAKKAMLTNAKKRVLMVDKNKLNSRSVMQTVAMSEITDIVINASVEPSIIKELEKFKNLKIHLA